MFKSTFVFAFLISLSLSVTATKAHAAPADPRNHDNWDIKVNGFVEMDSFFDSTRVFTEVMNAAAVPKVGTVTGDNGRTQMSGRNSRLTLKMTLPKDGDWKTVGVIESDFNGYNPTPPNPAGAAQTEQNFFSAAGPRLRLAYASLANENFEILGGQAWSLFGYQPNYLMINNSSSGTINANQRTPQIKVTKRPAPFLLDFSRYEASVAVSRPTQRDSDIPNIDFGARFFLDSRKSGFLDKANADYHLEPTSFAISGTYRSFSTPNSSGVVASDKMNYSGGGLAVSTIVPILTANDMESTKNSLTFLGEFIVGNGIADNYVGWSGGLGSLTTSTGAASNGVATSAFPNLDAGIAGYDSSGSFQLVQTQEFTAELQYTLPFEKTSVLNIEYARLKSANSNNLAANGSTSASAYDSVELYAVQGYYNFTPNIRVGLEYAKMMTHYRDDSYPSNNRYGMSMFYLF